MANDKVVPLPRVGNLTPVQSYLAIRAEQYKRSIQLAIEAWAESNEGPPAVVYLGIASKPMVLKTGDRAQVAHSLNEYVPPIPQNTPEGETQVYVVAPGRSGYVPWSAIKATKIVGSSNEVG